MIVRPFESVDAAACCTIINRCIPVMDGLNEAARAFLVAKNTPSKLAAELQALFAVVCINDQPVIGLGALEEGNLSGAV